MPRLSLGSLSVEPGQVGKGYLGKLSIANGSDVGIPIVIMNGRDPGPTLVVLASVHGTEISGIRALHAVLRAVSPDDLRGVLIAVTCCNPLAAAAGAYITPQDQTDLAIAFSGSSPTGSITQRISSIIWTAIERANYAIDIHANPRPALNFVLTKTNAYSTPADLATLKQMAQAFGVTVVNWDAPKRTSMDVCAERGIPLMMPELDGDLRFPVQTAEVGRRGVMNTMKALGLLPGDPEPQENIPVVKGELYFVGQLRANKGGIMEAIHPPGHKIAKGDAAIRIYDLFGDQVEEVTMPVTGYCWSYSTGAGANNSPMVTEGTALAYIFEDRGADRRSTA